MAKNTNADHSNLASPLSKVFTSPPSSAGKRSETPPLLQLNSHDTVNLTNSLNGITPTTTTDGVTVTHYSEERGTMEKISVPSLNIFNAEFKAEPNKSTHKPSTNPFLNITSSVPIISTKTTNPFHVSLTTNSTDPESASPIYDSLISNDITSICSENNNDTTATIISKKDEPKPAITNPFTVAIDEINTENHTVRINSNNNDTFNNFKNNNIAVNDKAEPTLDEKSKNKKNIEVIFMQTCKTFVFSIINILPNSHKSCCC